MQVCVARPAGTAGKCHAARCSSRRSNCYTAFRMSFSRSHAMADVWKGALAGFAATAPMTVAMWALDRSWRPTEQRLPPKQITRKLFRRFRLDRLLNESGKEAASWASHFGYGAATGAAYPLIAERIPCARKSKVRCMVCSFGPSVTLGGCRLSPFCRTPSANPLGATSRWWAPT
jgi:hypothetical protein